MDKTGQFRYKIKSTGYSSDRYGPCEICKQRVSDVHLQSSEELVIFEAIGDESDGPHWVARHTLFGHEQCLMDARITSQKDAIG